jgi:HK97 family phage prohead protease
MRIPQLQKSTVSPEFKFAGTPGSFEGYAARFGNTDNGGDMIEAGAFKDFAQDTQGRVLVLWQHSAHDPIGKAVVAQDSHGLHVRGALAVEDPTAAKAYGLMKAGVIDAMSIGYSILPGGAQTRSDGVRTLTALKLYEVSIVSLPMNELARVQAVKSAAECANVRELEHLLREAPHFQLSSRKAKAAANLLWPLLGDAREEQNDARDEREAVVHFADYLKQLNQLITKGN